MPIDHPLLLPMYALIAWTGVIWAWMMGTRVPAIVRARMRLDPQAPRGEQMALLPARVRWKADNYNHLMEQPQLYYATLLGLTLLGDATTISLALAWAYVAARVVHSLVQTLGNRIPTRFAVFMAGSIVLYALVGRALLRVI